MTLKRRGALRGCLGTLQCSRGLAAEVARCAADAASEDPRFPPVRSDELPDSRSKCRCSARSSAIDPADARPSPSAVTASSPNRAQRRGLLLPQVATEWGWTAEQFLRQTCVKAGLPGDAWQHGARIFRFDAEVFGE